MRILRSLDARLLLAGLLLIGAVPAPAQVRAPAPTWHPAASPRLTDESPAASPIGASRLRLLAQPETGRADLTLAALLASAAGFVGGAYLGYNLERGGLGWSCGCDDPGLEGLLYGAALGPAIAAPLGVHLANRQRGSLPTALGAAGAIALVGLGAMYATSGSEAGLVFVLGTPVAQAISAAVIESRTARRRQ